MAYTADANRLTNRYGTPTAQNVRDCTGSLERARLGAQLPIPELLPPAPAGDHPADDRLEKAE